MNLKRVVQEAKAELQACGFSGTTLAELVAQASDALGRHKSDRAEVMVVLRGHGASPNGKRLPDAVDEALRISKREPAEVAS